MEPAPEAEDVVRELDFSVEGGGESELGAGRDVVHELAHRPSFVGRPKSMPSWSDRSSSTTTSGGRITSRGVVPGVGVEAGELVEVEAVREEAHSRALAVDPACVDRGDFLNGDRLALDEAGGGARPLNGEDASHAGDGGGGTGGRERQVAFDEGRIEQADRLQDEAVAPEPLEHLR